MKKSFYILFISLLSLNLSAATVFDQNGQEEFTLSADYSEFCTVRNKYENGMHFGASLHGDFVVVKESVQNMYIDQGIEIEIDSSERSFVF